MSQVVKDRRSLPPIALILVFGLVAWGAYKLIPYLLNGLFHNNSSPIANRMSLGDKILVASATTAEKQAGVKAFAKGDYKEAAKQFQASLQQNRNDPETVIYLNNALASDRTPLKIAVSVPIASNPNVAQEILRGVAQAQDEINLKGGIKAAGLQVEIVSDDNSPEVAKEVAAALTNDPKTLAVIGHNSSQASLAAAPIYQQAKLVMVTPTSSTKNLSGFGSYIFRTVPTLISMAMPLAKYAVETAGKTNIAFCYDSQSTENLLSKDEFVASFLAAGGKLVPTVCDFAAPTFNPKNAIADAANNGAQGLMLAPQIDRIDRAIELARANQGKLALYGSSTLYTIQTLKEGQNDINGLVLSVPWHPETNPGNPFPENARQRWGGIVNWRTATSYDAAQAIIAGLQQSNTRLELQKALRNPSFSATGASENVKFLPTGDRAGKAILVEVKPGGKTGYTFVPLP